jgi:hypothetical protein
MAHDVCDYERLVSAIKKIWRPCSETDFEVLFPLPRIGRLGLMIHDEAKSHHHWHYHGDLLRPSLFIDSVTTPELQPLLVFASNHVNHDVCSWYRQPF